MAIRKALSYSKKHATPYTRRSSVKSKNYIKAVPQMKISKFRMGDIKGYQLGKYKIIVKLCLGEAIIIRDIALEAARQYVNKELETDALGQFYFEVRVYPHHVIRENKVVTGAGADRTSTGMQRSFGVTIARAAMVKKNQEVYLVAVNSEKAKRIAIKALEKVKAKLPGHARLVVEQKK